MIRAHWARVEIGVASAAGLHVSRIDGTPPRYNQPHSWLPDQHVCRPELGAAVLAAIQAARARRT